MCDHFGGPIAAMDQARIAALERALAEAKEALRFARGLAWEGWQRAYLQEQLAEKAWGAVSAMETILRDTDKNVAAIRQVFDARLLAGSAGVH